MIKEIYPISKTFKSLLAIKDNLISKNTKYQSNKHVLQK